MGTQAALQGVLCRLPAGVQVRLQWGVPTDFMNIKSEKEGTLFCACDDNAQTPFSEYVRFRKRIFAGFKVPLRIVTGYLNTLLF